MCFFVHGVEYTSVVTKTFIAVVKTIVLLAIDECN
jgi:hypothetical protein